MPATTRIVVKLTCAAAACCVSVAATAQEATPPKQPGFAVVELFTSEGCSSCPPADRLLGEIAAKARRDGAPVYALAFHVDYWDYIGWKDPYAAAAFSERQRAYGAQFGRGIYTPQMIVNGSDEFVGSNERRAAQAIESATHTAPKRPVTLKLEVTRIDTAVATIGFKIAGEHKGDKLHLAIVEDGLESKVSRGENSGRTLKHDCVVRVFKTLTLEPDAARSVSLDIPGDLRRKHARVVGYVQASDVGAILGASQTPLDATE